MQLARSNETKTDGHNSEHDFTKFSVCTAAIWQILGAKLRTSDSTLHSNHHSRLRGHPLEIPGLGKAKGI